MSISTRRTQHQFPACGNARRYGQVRETSPQTNKGTDNINLDR